MDGPLVTAEKACNRCRVVKSIELFARDCKKLDGRRTQCKGCRREDARRYSATHRSAHPESKASAKLKNLYGLEGSRYSEMLRAQRGCCAICARSAETFLKRLAVDHCHITDRVRGLLCFDCNVGLGKFKDCPKQLATAITYLGVV
jgi:hypothetical protein